MKTYLKEVFLSIYEYECICPKDIELYNNIKNDTDPIIIYNNILVHTNL